MTTSTQQSERTVDDIKHPLWCALDKCTPFSEGGVHRSHGTMWPSRADAGQTTVGLVHGDDLHPKTGEDGGVTLVRVQVFHTEYEACAVVELYPEEARLLAVALNRYADDAALDNGHDTYRYSAADVREVQQP